MKSMCQDCRRISPSVASRRPTSSCIRTAARIASSSTARSSAAVIVPAAKRSRAVLTSGGRSRLPTWSARNGGLGRSGNLVLLSGARDDAAAADNTIRALPMRAVRSPTTPPQLERLAAMLRARRFDETLIAGAELVTGVFHVSIGMEATAAALALERRDGDLITLNHRSHGALAAIGCDPELMYREILGRDGGPQRGRAGTLHLADATRGVPYTSAMVAGGPALATGMALARKRLREPGIVFAFFGDGALGEGAMHESLNLAALWRLPVLFVCESNAAPVEGRANALQAARSLHALAEVHQITAAVVDAGDAAAVGAAMRDGAAAVREGAGPHFIEARTPPWPGNAGFIPALATGALDLAAAVDAAPAAGWDEHDPLLREARTLLAAGAALEELLELDAPIATAMCEAFARARAAAPAPAQAAFEGVWA